MIPAQFAWLDYNTTDVPELRFVGEVENEPTIQFHNQDGVFFTIRSSKFEYNFEKYPHDTSKQAASRLFASLENAHMLSALQTKNRVTINLRAYKDIPAHVIEFSCDGVSHTFEHVELFYHHMFEHLSTMVRNRYS